MKFLTVLLFSFTLISCGLLTKESSIKDFENTIGIEAAKELSSVVEEFENHILSYYKAESLETAYKQYLNDVILKFDNKLNQKRKKQLIEKSSSGLIDKIWMTPDSTWIDSIGVNTIFHLNDNKDTITSCVLQKTNSKEIDSIFISEKTRLRFNPIGGFMTALKKASSSNKFIDWYIDTKETLDNISPELTADFILTNNPDYDNYFLKRIIIIETYY